MKANASSAYPSAPAGPGLNTAVERYYDMTLDLYEDLWGQHVHHGFWDTGEAPASTATTGTPPPTGSSASWSSSRGIPAGARVLDVGCGIGGPAMHLAGPLGCTVEGVTLSAAQAARANEKARAPVSASGPASASCDFLASDYPDASFDAVWALESLMHIADREAFFAEALRVLRPGGIVAVATWSVRDGELTAEEDLDRRADPAPPGDARASPRWRSTSGWPPRPGSPTSPRWTGAPRRQLLGARVRPGQGARQRPVDDA